MNDEYLLIIKQQQEVIAEQQQTIKNLTELLNNREDTEIKEYPTFENFAEIFLDDKIGQLKLTSFANYQNLLRSNLLPFFRGYKINEITSKEAQKFVNANEQLSKKTLQNCVRLLRNILNYAVETEVIENYKWLKVCYPQKIQEDVKYTLTQEEFEKLQTECVKLINNHTGYNYGLGILIAMHTGMRIGEVSGLQWKHIDLEAKIIRVRQTSSQMYVDGHQVNAITSPKSQTSIRDIPMTDSLYFELSRAKSDDNIYIISKKTEPVTNRLLRKHYDNLLKKLEIPHISFHKLRHNFSTLIQEHGATGNTAKQLLGHSSISMTEHYTHLHQDDTKEALQCFNTKKRKKVINYSMALELLKKKNEGYTFQELEVDYGISNSAILKAFQDYNFEYKKNPIGMKQKFSDEEKAEINKLYDWGLSQTNLAKQYKCSVSTINRIIKNKRKRHEITKELAENMLEMRKNGATMRDIANKYGYAGSNSIRTIFKKFGIKNVYPNGLHGEKTEKSIKAREKWFAGFRTNKKRGD